MHHVVLALALHEVHPRHRLVPGEPAHRRAERVGDLASGAVDAIGNPSWRCT
jgi:hypothetical protein